ncbi:hypothetical protein BOW53_03940 [Solemya pervernicosa gill symbiont]|uniref:DUF4124 domain-containing protein n=2 Tax=Gammaproteobacteria incertae sedis TaxID=118884 RepID=A0A1T2L8G5_9GAMM|nr:DUF4124 domain-containing protein [Candidatus Reidiella endopervernicosa]OOZ41407.1 hypothetical protein BOW53_03940 [Solemya pervernicosa gill symbiont]QKQ27554.1 DUF4124 domain-containing protein [Candidatus Reidiella endopervernicosa]
MRITILLTSLLILAPPIVGADIYKWVDDQGITHFTQQPPMSQPAETVKPRGIKPPDDAEAKKQRESYWDAFKKDKSQTEPKPISAENQAIRQENCKRAKENLQKLADNPGRRMRDNDGNVYMMPEEQRQQRMEEARKQIKENCN